MIIRNVQVTDLARLSSLEKQEFGDCGLNAVTMRQQIDLFAQTFFVAEQDDEIAGFVVGGVSVGTGCGWILDLVVNDKYQRQSIATELSQKCIEALRRYCQSKILLTVEPNNPARMLYKKLGFIEADLVSDYFGENAPRLIMELEKASSEN